MARNYDAEANMPLTLEQHFACLSKTYPGVQDLHSLWLLLRRDLEDRLPYSRGVFAHYSLHDASHSRSVICAIERFLGEERITALSATDTFMLLCCAYAHDYGMAVTYNQIYDILGTQEFLDFLEKQEKDPSILKEDIQAVKNLLAYMKEEKVTASLQEQYHFIMQALQMYLRPIHWKGVEDVWEDFQGLLMGRLNIRFIRGGEGIVDICEAHGQPFESIFKMNIRADGIIGDDFHPRFIAAMLRLGDLLDLDNGRFPRWLVTEIGRNREVIPKLSELHYKKHEAINHLLITPKRIEVCAACSGSESGYAIAGLVQDWLQLLERECKDLRLRWPEITQADFGRPPLITKNEILLDGKPYTAEERRLQMQMPQDRVMKLLEGTNIYQNRYIGIRELVQNAVDASLLQLWYDITHNRYIHLGVSKYGHRIGKDMDAQKDKEMGLLELDSSVLEEIFGNYPITIELIEDQESRKVLLCVKDRGTGITPEDARYMADIGSSKDRNERILAIMKDMPRWMKPSGVFGIGLQSVFQMSDRIEFYSRRPNEPERKIAFNSYGRNCGRIEIHEVTQEDPRIFYDNGPQGTNVKIALDPDHRFRDAEGNPNGTQYLYYDADFYGDDSLHALYVELSQAIKSILRGNPIDYFNIYYQYMTRENEHTPPVKGLKERLCSSYFSPHTGNIKGDSVQEVKEEDSVLPFYSKDSKEGSFFSFKDDKAYYFDRDTCRIYQLTVRKGTIERESGKNWLRLPTPVQNPYNIQYKFNSISNTNYIYPPSVRQLKKDHAGFLLWKINIMDDKPEKYLNIDRDRLREGSIIEAELIQVQEDILSRWCDNFIERWQRSESDRLERERRARAKFRRQGKDEDFREEPPKNIFADRPQLLISLSLLFYQYVPRDKFLQFIDPYRSFLHDQNLMLEEEFPVERLWEEDVVFQYSMPNPPGWLGEVRSSEELETPEPSAEKEPSEESEPSKSLEFPEVIVWNNEKRITCIPHRLIHIFSISRDRKGNLLYRFTLGRVSIDPCAIKMDYAARLHDYSCAIDPYVSTPNRINLDSLVNKLFKPNEMYPHLLVSTVPKPFKRGGNFASPMDHYIRWYILSPFDRDLTRWLLTFMKSDATEISTLTVLNTKAREYIQTSKHARRCIDYTYKQYTARMESQSLLPPENLLKLIEAEYRNFLMDCCQILSDAYR